MDSFYLGQYPVTQALWVAVMGENLSYFRGLQLPVEQVSWEDVKVFLEKLNTSLTLTGNRKYRLPTEAEWEYAARGGPYGRDYVYAGGELLDELGWYYENSQNQTRVVGLKAPNELGLYDMSGNVWEWCQDWYSDKYYQKCFEKGLVKNPVGPKSGDGRVIRGGGWGRDASFCRVADRSYNWPDGRDGHLGFRHQKIANELAVDFAEDFYLGFTSQETPINLKKAIRVGCRNFVKNYPDKADVISLWKDGKEIDYKQLK